MVVVFKQLPRVEPESLGPRFGARAGGGRAVAVATGPYSLAALRDCRPDHLFVDLSETEAVLRALFDHSPPAAQ